MLPNSEAYSALRDALTAVQRDPSAVVALLSSQADNGAGWVEAAYNELRDLLVLGRVSQAEQVGNLIGVVLQAQEGGAEDELAENRLHHECMQWLTEGIGAILAQDNLTGMAYLRNITGAVYANESLQWVAWLWLARAAADAGDLATAKSAAQAALDLGSRLDAQAFSTTLCISGEIEFLRGEYDQALEHLTEATRSLEQLGHRRGTATAWLARARVEAGAGRREEGMQAALRAHEWDPEWEQPILFVARQAMLAGDVDEAEQTIVPLWEADSRSAELQREMRLIQLVRQGKVSVAVVAEYLELRERPPSSTVVTLLKHMVGENPGFLQARELLAWTFLKLGQEGDAEGHLEFLAEQNLDPGLQASVLLGLGCLANRKHLHRQPGARVAAAAAAMPESIRAAGGTRSGEVQVVKVGSMSRPAEVELELDAPPPPSAVVGGEVMQPTGSHPGIEAPGSVARAAFTGDLMLLAVPDLLEFLRASRRTGTLVVTTDHGIGAVYLARGMITGAASPGCSNLGDLLLERRAITEEQLAAATDSQVAESPDELLGAILAQRGTVSPETVRQVLEDQVHRALLEMVGWTEGRFAFEPDKGDRERRPAEIEIELDSQAVLLEVLRRFDEAAR